MALYFGDNLHSKHINFFEEVTFLQLVIDVVRKASVSVRILSSVIRLHFSHDLTFEDVILTPSTRFATNIIYKCFTV